MLKPAEIRDRIPFIKDMGIEVTDVQPGSSRLELSVQPRHLNGWRAVHGGVTMTVLDVAMAIAARSLEPEVEGVVTVEMKCSFMQAGPPTGRLLATGTCVHRSTTMAFCESEVRDEANRLLARAMGTFKYLRPGA
jgi:acyl-CoA thioesterase